MNRKNHKPSSLVVLILLIAVIAYILGRSQTTFEEDKQAVLRASDPTGPKDRQPGLFDSKVSNTQEEKADADYRRKAEQLMEEYAQGNRTLTDHEIRELREIIKRETGGTYYLHTPRTACGKHR